MDQNKCLFLLDCMDICENHDMIRSVWGHHCMCSIIRLFMFWFTVDIYIYIFIVNKNKNWTLIHSRLVCPFRSELLRDEKG